MNCPKHNVTKYESSCTNITPKIEFHQYVLFLTCFIHGLLGEGRLIYNLCDTRKYNGKIRSRKILIQKELTIGNSMYDIYTPSLEKYIYHDHYVQILLKYLG